MILNIKVGSVTNAQRGYKLLRQKGYKPSIKKLDTPSPGSGCGYMLVVSSDDSTPIHILSDYGIAVRGVDEG